MEKRESPKIGAGHASAMFRQGLRELRNALYADSNVAAPMTEYGIYGTRTPGEIADAREAAPVRNRDEEPRRPHEPVLGQPEAQAQERIQESLPRGMEAER